MVKTGFSLAEALVVMGIISMFFVAATKVVTVKRPEPQIIQPHGTYHCMYNENREYFQAYNRNGVQEQINPVEGCTFTAPIGVAGYHLYAYGPTTSGYASHEFMHNIPKSLNITVGGIPNRVYITPRDVDQDQPIEMIATDNSQFIYEHIRLYFPDIYENNINPEIRRYGLIISW